VPFIKQSVSKNESDENDSSSITLLPVQNGTKLLTGRSHLDQVVLEVFASLDSTSTILAAWEQQGFQVVLIEDEENTVAVVDQNDPKQIFGFQRIQVASAAHPVFKIQQLSSPRAGESLTQQVEKF